MAYGNNTNAPVGFKPYRYYNGSLWTGQESTYDIASGYATSLFEGDPITFLSNGTIGICGIGAACAGVFQGATWTDTTGVPQYSNFWTGATVTQGAGNAFAKVVADSNVVFDIQVSTAVGGTVAPVALAQANIFKNANFGLAVTAFTPTLAPVVNYAANPGAGSTSTGISGYYLDYNSLANTDTLNCKIIGLTPVPGNVVSTGGTASGTLNFNNALVLINNHVAKGGTGTAGV